ncbi:MAG: Ku protein [Erysipelotrichales bacterium]|nr:Ku protein [Erysipelotrichales bacterium]
MASYKGAISFGLVYIPISLSVSVKENDIGFNMLDKKTMSRIKYKKTCIDCENKEVKQENIVKGYQYEKDKYVIFTDKDFEKLKSEKDKNIVIQQFVDLDEVDPIYYDKSYYVTPTSGEKAFNVLLEAMEKQNKAGIAKSVIGTKDTLILIRVQNGKMLANTLYFQNEIQKCPEIKKSKVDSKELKLAINLINQMTAPFKPEKFKDEYTDKVKKAIKQKISGKQIIETKNKNEPTEVINLMEALKQSLNGKNRRSRSA